MSAIAVLAGGHEVTFAFARWTTTVTVQTQLRAGSIMGIVISCEAFLLLNVASTTALKGRH